MRSEILFQCKPLSDRRSDGVSAQPASHAAAEFTGSQCWLAGDRSGVNILFQAAYFILLARLLGVREYGIFAGAFAFVSIAFPYSALGSGLIFVRYVSTNSNNFAVYWGNILLATFGVGSLLTVLMVWIAPHLLNPASVSLILMVALGLSYPQGVAVDGAGNVYIADTGHNRILKETLANGSYTQSIVKSGVDNPQAVAVDSQGNLYIAWEPASGTVPILKETPQANGSYLSSNIGSGFSAPVGISVDANGNVYVADSSNAQVYEETLQSDGSYVQSTLSLSGLTLPNGVAVDAYGSVYATDGSSNNDVVKLDLSAAPSLSFHSTMLGETSADSPLTVTVENSGNAALNFSEINFPVSFPESGSAQTDCATAAHLPADETCTLTIDFSPLTVGSPGGFLVLTDDALNAASATQSISLKGTGTDQASHFKIVTASNPVAAGAPSSITVKVYDVLGNLFTGYTGTVHFSSTDGSAVLPANSTLTGGAGTFNVTLKTIGTQTVTATDTTTSSITGTSNLITVGQPPAITSGSGTTFTVGAPYAFSVTASGYPVPTFTDSGTLPSGVDFNKSGDGMAVLEGIPAAGTSGSYPISITASNGIGSNATQNFTLTVNQAPAITSANSVTFTAGVSGSFTVTTSGFPKAARSPPVFLSSITATEAPRSPARQSPWDLSRSPSPQTTASCRMPRRPLS